MNTARRPGPKRVPCGRRPGKNFFDVLQHWSGAVTCPACLMRQGVAAGPNALRGSGPKQKRALKKMCVDPSGFSRSPERPNLHYAVMPSPIYVADLAAGLPHAASDSFGSLYLSPRTMMAQAIRAILLASAMAATLVGRRPNKAVSQGRCPVPWNLA